MTIPRANPGGWAGGAELLTSLLNQLDTNPTWALDRRAGQTDTLAAVIALSGAGRIVQSRVTGANAPTTYKVSGAAIVQLTSAITSNVVYTLSTADAIDADQITFFADPTFLFEVSIGYGNGTFVVGNLGTSDARYVTFFYTSAAGWLVCGGQGSRYRIVTFTSSGTWTCPRGVTNVILVGCGGGGGGGAGASTPLSVGGNQGYGTGGAGGGGANLSCVVVPVTPGTAYPVTIGAGGQGASTEASVTGSSGAGGGDTTFGGLASFTGAGGGMGGNLNTPGSVVALLVLGGSSAGRSVFAYPDRVLVQGQPGQNVIGLTPYPGSGGHSATANIAPWPAGLAAGGNGARNSVGGFAGGVGGVQGVGTTSAQSAGGGGGGGGAGPGGAGGAGGIGANVGATTFTAVNGAPGGNGLGFGAGGGGGGGGTGSGPLIASGYGGAGGNGFPGVLQVIYVK